jgi:autophagy-related protein 17
MGSPAAESPLSSNGSLYTKQPTLDELVEHFLAAKRSLSTIVQVWRAREIVDAGREAIEEHAILSAKNAFVRQAIDVQGESLLAIRHGAHVVESEGHQELQVKRISYRLL